MIETFLDIVARRLEALVYRTGKHSLHIVGQSIYTMHMSLAFRRFHPFYEEFSKIILQIHASGIMVYTTRMEIDRGGELDKEDAENIGPQVLTMDHLDIAFIVCTLPMIFAFLAFFFEILIPILKILKRKAFNC